MRMDKAAIFAIGRLSAQRRECLRQPDLWGPGIRILFTLVVPRLLERGEDPAYVARTFAPLAVRRADEICRSIYVPLDAEVISRPSEGDVE